MSATLLERISAFPKARVLVVGDVMLDRYVYGAIVRISPEAPVPVLLAGHEAAMLGGAANVARGIAALGGKATLIGVVGNDEAGRTLKDLAVETPGIETALVVAPDRPTTLKVRYIAERQQVVRVDYEVRTPLGPMEAPLMAQFQAHLAAADVVVLSDYAKGVLSDAMVAMAIAEARAAGKPVIVDPKRISIVGYDGATVITPNLSEATEATGLTGRDDDAVSAMADVLLAAAPRLQAVLITRSERGMSLAQRGGDIRHLPVVAREVADVSGAGDTVVATLALAMAAGSDLCEAAALANSAAGIVVGKAGTAVVTPEELGRVLQNEKLISIATKTVECEEAVRIVREWKRLGLRVGFTNGCFDLLHPGHVSLLDQARRACDRLVVGLNTDESIRRLKGPSRPVQGEAARAMVLGAMAQVDLVVPFGDDTPLALIQALRPDVLVKGADYRLDQIVGADVVQRYGGRVVRAELVAGQSTSKLIARSNGGA